MISNMRRTLRLALHRFQIQINVHCFGVSNINAALIDINECGSNVECTYMLNLHEAMVLVHMVPPRLTQTQLAATSQEVLDHLAHQFPEIVRTQGYERANLWWHSVASDIAIFIDYNCLDGNDPIVTQYSLNCVYVSGLSFKPSFELTNYE